MTLSNERLRLALKERGLSQNALARLLGITRSVFSRLVNEGLVDEKLVQRISEAMNVDAKWFYGESNNYTTLDNKVVNFKDLETFIENRNSSRMVHYPERLRYSLLERGSDHVQLAHAIDVYTKSTLKHVRGEAYPSEDILSKTASFLKVTPEWLNGEADSYITRQGETISFKELVNRAKNGCYDVVVEEKIEDLVDREMLAEALKTYIEMRGFRQKDLARKSGVYQSMISLFLSGKTTPQFSTLLRLAEAVGIDPREVAEKKREGGLER